MQIIAIHLQRLPKRIAQPAPVRPRVSQKGRPRGRLLAGMPNPSEDTQTVHKNAKHTDLPIDRENPEPVSLARRRRGEAGRVDAPEGI
ncbi:hypothetical protein WJ972_22580 [Achromobacter insuavis]